MRRISYVACAVLIAAVAVTVQAGLPLRTPTKIPAPAGGASLDLTAMYDANNLNMVVTNIGSFGYDDGGFYGKNDGLYYPARDPNKSDNTSVIYAGGIWIGALVAGEIRVAVAEYSQDFVPGTMVNGAPAPDNQGFHVYKITRGDTTSEDYVNWPVADGAPVGQNGKPLLIGDQTLWCVYNDADPASHNSGATKPLGLEVQQTVFGFARTGALGNCVFVKFRMINKGSNTLTDTYVSCWADPDLGGAADDLVGCDVDLSLGYCYNSTNADNSYKSTPPAVGYDFFQGPIVPAEDDTAYVSGRPVLNFRNLPMTSFNKYINGTDPDSPEEIYNYMKGLQPDGSDLVDPVTGQVTKFFVSGDPVAGTGWLDDTPADRRYMQSSGPFVMVPGDTQEVVIGIIVGQGSDRLTSITALKFYDDFAQTAFNLNFDLPIPPAPPVLETQVLNGQVILNWGTQSEEHSGDFPFQGYNVWQSRDGSNWKRIVTYDVADGAAIIFDNVFDVETGVVVNKPVQFGDDGGVRRYYVAEEDEILGGPLRNMTDYFYAVTAYSYDPTKTPKTLENPQSATKVSLTPQRPVANTEYTTLPFDTLLITHTSSASRISDGSAVTFVVKPPDVTGHSYHVEFRTDEDLGMVWDLIDESADTAVLSGQTNQSGDNTYPIVDGLMVKVIGPALGVNALQEVATSAGPITPDNVHMSRNSTSDWYMDPFGDQTFGRYSWRGATNHDYEIRFTEEATEYCWDFYGPAPDNAQDYPTVFKDTLGNISKVPLEIWDVTDNRRITFMNLDDDASGSFTWGDGLYLLDVDYNSVTWEIPGINADQYTYQLHLGRFRFMDLSGLLTRPAPGTIVRVTTNKTNTTDDRFSFTTPGSIIGSDSLAATRLDRVQVVPNPYYNSSGFDVGQNDHRVRFQNLPDTCTIRIFNLAGELVATIMKATPVESFAVWDLLTMDHLPVASGVYLYQVEAPGIGEFFGKMAIFVEKEQLNTF